MQKYTLIMRQNVGDEGHYFKVTVETAIDPDAKEFIDFCSKASLVKLHEANMEFYAEEEDIKKFSEASFEAQYDMAASDGDCEIEFVAAVKGGLIISDEMDDLDFRVGP